MDLIFRRIFAEMIDVCICWAAAFLIQSITHFPIPFLGGWIKETGWMFVLCIAYETIWTSITGQTAGKYLMHIEVRKIHHEDLSLSSSFLRALVKNATVFLLYGIFCALSILMMTQDLHLSIHDRIAGTRVWIRRNT